MRMPEPRDKLDASANGPEDPPGVFDGDAWQRVDWRTHEERVRRLRRRIFRAVRDGDLAKVRNLQKLMLCSWSNTRSEEHTSELQSRFELVCRLLLEQKKGTLP